MDDHLLSYLNWHQVGGVTIWRQHIEDWMKWPPLYRRHIQMILLKSKGMKFEWNFNKILLRVCLTKLPTKVYVIAACPRATNHKLSEYWPRLISPYGINVAWSFDCFLDCDFYSDRFSERSLRSSCRIASFMQDQSHLKLHREFAL